MANDWQGVRLVAHRCGGRLAPENSLGGLAVAARHGYRAVEFDVMLSADGEPVVIHDETLERTTDGHGRVADLALAVLQGLSLGGGWPPEWAAERLPTLVDVLGECRRLGLLANVEIKPSAGTDEATGEIVARRVGETWQRFGGEASQLLLSSFSLPALRRAQAVAPALARAWLVDRVPADWRQTWSEIGAAALHASARGAADRAFGEVVAAGVCVRCYTVNSPARARRLFRRGVAAVFTDALPELARCA